MANHKLEYHPAAEAEIYGAAKWYKARSITAARRFALELEAKIEVILDGPERWPLFESGTRRILLNRFPFSIIYRVTGEVVEIVAVMHQRREPGYWGDR
ncbi:MAG: type II toxin-antitoxin system RelE/ParE family toxin [Pyrinomonadaceae bacterium]